MNPDQTPNDGVAAVTAHPHRDTIVVLDYGSQYARLIVRRVRECRVYAELLPWDAPADRIRALNPRGFILSGGPNSVYDPGAPTLQDTVLDLGVPVLGICYGMQLLAHHLGGQVHPVERREFGHASVTLTDTGHPLFRSLPDQPDVWMSHGDQVTALPDGFHPIASTPTCPVAAMATLPGTRHAPIMALQFHPEVAHTPQGLDLLRNFCLNIAGCSPRGHQVPSLKRLWMPSVNRSDPPASLPVSPVGWTVPWPPPFSIEPSVTN